MDESIDELNTLLKPMWGSEKWISKGWTKITPDERLTIKKRVEKLFENGLPFTINHDKYLYIYIFSLMAQLEVLGIQLPLLFKDQLKNSNLRQRMHAQLVDEIFHAIIFTKIVFMLSAPYQFPPEYNEEIEKICEYIRSQECVKVGVVVMNLVCEGLVEEVFSIMHKNNIAPELFELVLEDEHRHVCEADLYTEIGLPDQEILKEKLTNLEELIISAFSLQPQYSIALSTLLGPKGTIEFLSTLNEKHVHQLKKINMAPSDKWELTFHLSSEINREFNLEEEQLNGEVLQEFFEVEMPPISKILMTQFDKPGDPAMVVQFNVDISDFGFFENKFPQELLSTLMMQAVSHVLASHDKFRNFLSFNKLHCSQGAYVTILEKLPDCGDHLGTVFFRNCHEITTQNLLNRIERSKQMMAYCYKKREQVELEDPSLKQKFDQLLYEHAHSVHPFPLPGHYNVYLSNIGRYGYTQAKVPLLKQGGLHITLLAVDRKQVWNQNTKSFETKDYLPISISADSRIFDGQIHLPDLFNASFQTMLQKLNAQLQQSTNADKTGNSEYDALINQITHRLLTQKNVVRAGKIMAYLKNKKIVLKEAQKLLGEEINIYGKNLSQYTQFDNLANQLILDYLGFDAKKARNSEQFTKLIDKILNENKELGYHALYSMQTAWLDYLDVESHFNTIYEKIADKRLYKLAKWLPKLKN